MTTATKLKANTTPVAAQVTGKARAIRPPARQKLPTPMTTNPIPAETKFNLSRFNHSFTPPAIGPLPTLQLADPNLTYFWVTRAEAYANAFIFVKESDPIEEQYILNRHVLLKDDDGYYCFGDAYPGLVLLSAVQAAAEHDHNLFVQELMDTGDPEHPTVYSGAAIEGVTDEVDLDTEPPT